MVEVPHPYKIRYRSVAGKQVEESGFATQGKTVARLTEVYNARKTAPRGQARVERIARYGAMRFEEYAREWKAWQRHPAGVGGASGLAAVDPSAAAAG
ncbi:hypothetical protein ACR6C2_04675 [Streptomyces sp. INA 01156]